MIAEEHVYRPPEERLLAGRGAPPGVLKWIVLPLSLTALFALMVTAAPASANGPDPLPPGYAYELVAPPFSHGQSVGGGLRIAEGGNAVAITSVGALEDVGNLPDLGSTYYAHRTEERWQTVPMMPPATLFPTWSTSSAGGVDFTKDLKVGLWWGQLREDKNTRRFTLVRTDVDGSFEIAGPTFDHGSSFLGSSPMATSADLRTIVYESPLRNVATDGTTDNRLSAQMSLYVSRPDSDVPGGFDVRQIAYRSGAAMLRTCRVILGGSHSARGSVSEDGERIFFGFAGPGACAQPANQRVWMKEGNAEPEDISASQCSTDCGGIAPANYEVASFDGERVYFSTEQKLVDDDLDESSQSDLYVYDFEEEGSRLRPVTASGATGQGAGVLGVVRASDDGSYVYFVANGRPLAGENTRGESPQPGDNNLYVYHRPRSPLSATESIRFVSKLDSVDVERLTQFSLLNIQSRPVTISRNNRFLLFMAFTDLTGEKLPGDNHRDLFRYDLVEDEFVRIWSDEPQNNGVERTDGVFPSNLSIKEASFEGMRQKERMVQQISDDGKTIAFATDERLSMNDVNSGRDGYMWREETDEITLLTSGRSIRESSAAGVSPGGDVFVVSDAPLTPEHRSGQITVFVVRKGGGFPAPPPPPVPCVGDDCQGPASSVPPTVPAIGSISFGGDGNVISPPVPGRDQAVRVSRLKAALGSVAKLKVRSPGAGRVTVSGPRVRSATRSVRAARTVTLRVALKPRQRKVLRKKRTLKVAVRVAYRATDGRSASKSLALTFKQPKAKRASAMKGER